jgi:hypothetical protein
MHQKVRQWTAIMAAALVLAYVSTAAATEVRDFALWQASSAWLGVFAAICGALLALIHGSKYGAAWYIVVAPVLAVLILAGVRCYILWSFLGEFLSLFEIMVSNLFIYQVLPRSFLILIITVPFGLLGVAVVKVFLPDRYHP